MTYDQMTFTERDEADSQSRERNRNLARQQNLSLDDWMCLVENDLDVR